MKSMEKKKIYLAVCIVCGVLVMAEALFTHAHGPAWRAFPGASIVIAFVGGWALILLSKKLLGPLLQRDNDYYDKKGGEDNE